MHCKDSEVLVTVSRDTHSGYNTVDRIPKHLSDGGDGAAGQQHQGCHPAVQPEHHIVQPETGPLEVVAERTQYGPNREQSNPGDLLISHH